MLSSHQLLAVSTGSKQLISQLIQTFQQAGLQVVQSFDLQSVRTHTSCSCPHHGTAHCSCQMAVFLVYGLTPELDPEPVTLVVHGRDEYATINLLTKMDKSLQNQLEETLRSALD